MTMQEDIQRYPIYGLSNGKLIPLSIENVNQYNHNTHNLHHFIKKGDYARNQKWYDERGIKQKLILLPIYLHEQVHLQAVKNLTDKEFMEQYKISRWDLLFNRRHTEY